MTEWKIQPFSRWDKKFTIAAGGVSTNLIIDYDDVDHDQVNIDAAKIARILSDYWDHPIYAVERCSVESVDGERCLRLVGHTGEHEGRNGLFSYDADERIEGESDGT